MAELHIAALDLRVRRPSRQPGGGQDEGVERTRRRRGDLEREQRPEREADEVTDREPLRERGDRGRHAGQVVAVAQRARRPVTRKVQPDVPPRRQPPPAQRSFR